MQYETKMQKGYDGWKATSEQFLDNVPAQGIDAAGERFVRFSTSKDTRRGGLSTMAYVLTRRMTDRGYATETTAIFGDYTRTILVTPCARVTDKNVKAAHEEALKLIPRVMDEVRAFYLEKKAGVA